jgi:hypothetical protein
MGGGWLTPRPGRFIPGKKTRYRWLGGPQGRSGQLRKISPPPGFESRTVQPVANTQGHYWNKIINKNSVSGRGWDSTGTEGHGHVWISVFIKCQEMSRPPRRPRLPKHCATGSHFISLTLANSISRSWTPQAETLAAPAVQNAAVPHSSSTILPQKPETVAVRPCTQSD